MALDGMQMEPPTAFVTLVAGKTLLVFPMHFWFLYKRAFTHAPSRVASTSWSQHVKDITKCVYFNVLTEVFTQPPSSQHWHVPPPFVGEWYDRWTFHFLHTLVLLPPPYAKAPLRFWASKILFLSFFFSLFHHLIDRMFTRDPNHEKWRMFILCFVGRLRCWRTSVCSIAVVRWVLHACSSSNATGSKYYSCIEI